MEANSLKPMCKSIKAIISGGQNNAHLHTTSYIHTHKRCTEHIMYCISALECRTLMINSLFTSGFGIHVLTQNLVPLLQYVALNIFLILLKE